ncbi:Ribosomal protein S30 [uncultured archaeon]|nr:Ribosomal protein S30 [uncultured archaeon]
MPTHGSLTKAGKVRGQTPKVQARERHGVIASSTNRQNFRKRFLIKRVPGQNKPGQRRKR